MEEKTKSVIGIVIIIVGLIAYNYYEYNKWCDGWFLYMETMVLVNTPKLLKIFDH
jgi:hypothetical protein